jgi:hypothetical protein
MRYLEDSQKKDREKEKERRYGTCCLELGVGSVGERDERDAISAKVSRKLTDDNILPVY